MDLVRYDPFEIMDRIADTFDSLRDIDRWFDFPEFRFLDTFGLYEGEWSPALDMYEDDDAYFVKVDVPGVDPKDIEISATSDVLTIKGVRRIEEGKDKGKKKGKKYEREEIFYGEFHRTVPLPMPVDPDRIDAKIKDGVLYITLPKKEELKPKKINVKVS